MSQPLGYPSPRHYPATVTDRWGHVATTLTNDGRTFTLALRGNRFAGASLDGLELVGPLADPDRPPTRHHGDLWSCVIEWRMPITVAQPETEPADVPLSARLRLGDPGADTVVDTMSVVLTLHLPAADLTTAPREHMEDALLDLQRQLPDGTRLRACISCAFSDYFPAGSGFIGLLACFRDHKDTYRTVTGKSDLFAVWDKNSGPVQETFGCDEHEPRPPGTGYRG